jgi:hypothetical protein
MANTTNFGWETPDDTDLVKDGAAAIRTLGQAIDTSMQDLEGGTTGQILSKNSNADMDFVWITNDVGDITEVVAGTGLSGGGSSGSVTLTNTVATEFDAKGDLVVGTGADTFDKLSAGTNNHRLVAASGETTGLKYVADTQNTVIDAAGDLVYGTAADTLGRLAIGTAGQVLKVNSGATAPEWGAAGGASALTKITSASFTTQSSVAIDGCFTSTYTKYFVIWEAIASVADADLQLQFRYAGPSTQTSTASGSGFGYVRGNTVNTWGYVNQAQNTIINALSTATSFGSITFDNVGNSSQQPIFYGQGFGDSFQAINQYSGYNDTARTYTGFLLKPDSGTITGTYAVYGLEN